MHKLRAQAAGGKPSHSPATRDCHPICVRLTPNESQPQTKRPTLGQISGGTRDAKQNLEYQHVVQRQRLCFAIKTNELPFSCSVARLPRGDRFFRNLAPSRMGRSVKRQLPQFSKNTLLEAAVHTFKNRLLYVAAAAVAVNAAGRVASPIHLHDQ